MSGSAFPTVMRVGGNADVRFSVTEQLDEAEVLYRRVIAIKEARLGGKSPALAGTLNNLGTLLRASGRPGEARAAFERAFRLLESAVEESHPTLDVIRRNLARLS